MRDPSDGDWARTARPSDLELVAQALEEGRLTFGSNPLTALQSLGIGDPSAARAFLESIPARDPGAVAWCLRLLVEERRGAADRLARCAQLVWSGHRDGTQPLRDTRSVLDEVCARAERRILLSTFVIYDGRQSLLALSRRMREVPGLEVDFYVNLHAAGGHAQEDGYVVAAWLNRFQEKHWPEDVRLPAIWYDPQTLDRTAGITLHAKCLVVDERWAFVTSANFTEAAQDRNLEVGVLLDHPTLAQALQAQFQSLRERGGFRRIPGT